MAHASNARRMAALGLIAFGMVLCGLADAAEAVPSRERTCDFKRRVIHAM